MKLKNIVYALLIGVFFFLSVNTVIAWPRRPVVRRPVVVKPKVVVTPKKKVVTSSVWWPKENVTQEKITPEEIEKRRIKPEYGLIDFEIYPSTTKIYIDGNYKGYARTLNKDRYSSKVRKGKHVIELKRKNAPIKIITVFVEAGYKTIVEQE